MRLGSRWKIFIIDVNRVRKEYKRMEVIMVLLLELIITALIERIKTATTLHA